MVVCINFLFLLYRMKKIYFFLACYHLYFFENSGENNTHTYEIFFTTGNDCNGWNKRDDERSVS